MPEIMRHLSEEELADSTPESSEFKGKVKAMEQYDKDHLEPDRKRDLVNRFRGLLEMAEKAPAEYDESSPLKLEAGGYIEELMDLAKVYKEKYDADIFEGEEGEKIFEGNDFLKKKYRQLIQG